MICPQCQANMTIINKNIGTCPRCHYTGAGVCPICRQQVIYSYCFIATAAYGTSMAKEVEVLRGFRDRKLESMPLGRQIVLLYYRISPPIAEIISRDDRLRATVRAILHPILGMIKRKNWHRV